MIRVSQLVKRFGGRVVLNGVSFELKPGSVTAFIGRNGAGKTTTIKIITGLLPPDGGWVDFPGCEPARFRQQMGYMADNPFLYSHLTGREFLEFLCAVRRVPYTSPWVQSLIEQFEMGPYMRQLTLTYSLGTRRKLAIIAALIHQPHVLILDEPTVGLDPLAVVTLKGIMKQTAAQGGVVFMSTHLLATAQEVCDQALILHEGRIAGCFPLTGQDPALPGHLERLFVEVVQGGSG